MSRIEWMKCIDCHGWIERESYYYIKFQKVIREIECKDLIRTGSRCLSCVIKRVEAFLKILKPQAEGDHQ